jgi:NAD(P)-dependent dehydrogenase (short-subunit alcohol dehydrogenase family)
VKAAPMKRIATPEDVAEVILFLIASAGFVTGQTVVVDGGRRM